MNLGFFPVLTDEIVFLEPLQTALDIRQSVFGGKNIHVATAHEDLAYSSYVHQYSSGKFDNALWVQHTAAQLVLYMEKNVLKWHRLWL